MGVEYKDYYKLLGVSRSATKEDMSKAFKKLARQYHPDLNPGNKEAEEKFKDINEAYEVLKDDEKRKLYDQLGANWQHGQNFQRPSGFDGFNFQNGAGGNFDASGFSDFFETLFGGAGRGQGFGPDPFGSYSRNRPKRGRDVEAEISISLEDAYKGGRKNISIKNQQGSKSLEVNIPAGVKEGARIRLSGQGDPGSAGGQAGDMYLKIKLLPHPNFSLEQNDLIYDLMLAPWEAALGVKVRVPTLDGEVELNIPAGSGSGKKLRLRGKGLGTGESKGDEYIRINIRVPEVQTDVEKKLWEQLAETSGFKARA